MISNDISSLPKSNLTTPRNVIDLIIDLETSENQSKSAVLTSNPNLDETEKLVDLIDELDFDLQNQNLSAFSSDLESDPILADLFFKN